MVPLKKEENIAVIGALAKHLRYQGAGSSHINPWKLTSPCDASPDIPFYEGYAEDGEPNAALLREAVSAAGKAKVAVVFAGNQQKVAECLSLADVVVSSNVRKPEAFGRSMAEASLTIS